MLFKNNKYKVLELFFDMPGTEFNIRRIARLTKTSTTTVASALKELLKKEMVRKRKAGNAVFISANRESAQFIREKRLHNIEKIYNSGLVEYLVKEYSEPDAIILFGSFSRGEDTENSDIDIAVINGKGASKIGHFEDVLKRKISLHEINLRDLEKEFFLNLANGFVLYGAIYERV